MSNDKIMYRHGDLLIIPTDDIKRTDPRSDNILASGEVTGHHHKLLGNANIFGKKEGSIQYVEVIDPTTLTHEEHATINLTPGTYKVLRQREYDCISEMKNGILSESLRDRNVLD